MELWGTRSSSSKHHRLINLGGCRLLDGLVEVPHRALQGRLQRICGGDCERHYACLTGAVKSSSEIKVWEVHWPSGLKIKRRLNRWVVECFESTTTWIRGDRQVTKTTIKILISGVLISCFKVYYLNLLWAIFHCYYYFDFLFTLGCKPSLAQHMQEDLILSCFYINLPSVFDFS